MNTHLTEGELRASLDLELEPAQTVHLENCPECQAKQRQAQAEQARVARRLAFLTPGSEPVPPASAAWERFPKPNPTKKELPMLRRLFAYPVARVAAIATLALTIVLAFPTTRALASELLNLFRVQRVTVLPIDISGMENITGNETLGKQFSRLLSDSTVVTQEPGEPVQVADAEAASQSAGFQVRLPAGVTPESILVSGASAFQFTIDRAKTQALLNEAGRGDLVLPENADGARISVSIPAAVSTTFGTCPEFDAKQDPDQAYRGFDEKKYADCLVFAQIPSPSVNAPASLDVEALAQVALELTGMKPAEAAALARSVDWTSTLVVPMPRGMATHSEISVDGVTGTLIQQDSEYAPEFVLMWVKDGVVYFVSGPGTDTTRALELVNSLP